MASGLLKRFYDLSFLHEMLQWSMLSLVICYSFWNDSYKHTYKNYQVNDGQFCDWRFSTENLNSSATDPISFCYNCCTAKNVCAPCAVNSTVGTTVQSDSTRLSTPTPAVLNQCNSIVLSGTCLQQTANASSLFTSYFFTESTIFAIFQVCFFKGAWSDCENCSTCGGLPCNTNRGVCSCTQYSKL